MRKYTSSFYPFKKPLYGDVLFYFFIFYSLKGMKENLFDFIQYGEPNRLISLLIDFTGSIFTAWVMSTAINAIKQYFVSKRKSKALPKFIKSDSKYFDPNLRITKLDNPIGEMNEEERKLAAAKLSNIMMEQLDDFKKNEEK
jgi:hypothetical protein